MKKLDDLNLIYSLLVSESRMAGTRKPNNCVKPRIVKGDLEAEVKGAFKPVDDPFSLSTWPPASNESGDFIFCTKHLLLPFVLLIVTSFSAISSKTDISTVRSCRKSLKVALMT
jgi:hypothetical protein